MSGFGTKFTETEALLYAAQDCDADSGAYAVDAYLRENFLPGELRKLSETAQLLADRAWEIGRQMQRTTADV